MTHRMIVNVKLISNLIFSSRSGDSTMTRSYDYIPGSSILGWCAHMYIRQNGKADAEFMRLFVHGGIVFENLYITDGETSFVPSSLALKHPKYEANPVKNSLVQPCEDYYSIRDYCSIDKKTIKVLRVKKSISFHHDRDYDTGVSTDGAVFSYESINKEQEFSGAIIGGKADLLLVKEWFSPGIIRLGKSKTAQYGEAEVSTSEIIPVVQVVEPPDSCTMTLLSDMILLNKFGYSTLSIGELEALLGVGVISSHIASNRIDGILNVWHCRKPSDNTFAAGTTFVLEKLPDNWNKLENDGVGERKHEGYGRVSFKVINEDSYNSVVITKVDNENLGSVLMPPPSIIKDICSTIILANLSSHVQTLAYNLAVKIPVSSLSKSLISNLEGFARNEDFSKQLLTLKNKAINSMKDTKWDSENFFDYLVKIKIRLTELLNEHINTSCIKPLTDTAKYSLDIDYVKLEEEFLLTVFTNIRKQIKLKEDNQEDANE